jgi:DNA-binding PadR family transcriptional regulator
LFPFHFRFGRFFEKGDVKYVVLKALKGRPMHGYEVMKAIGEDFSGFYTPSPGVVYPTLQMLEDLGYVKVVADNGRRTYSMTDSGLKFLEEREQVLGEVLARKERFFPAERIELMKEARRLAKTLFTSFNELTPSKADRIRTVLEDARQKVNVIIEE